MGYSNSPVASTYMPIILLWYYHTNFTTGVICMHIGTEFAHDIATIISD